MTRAQGPDSELQYRSFGSPGASRVVVLLRTGPVATTDPDPSITTAHAVRVLAIELDDPELDDPPSYAGETPAESTTHALSDLIAREAPGQSVGLVAERGTAAIGSAVAAELGARVDRFALVAAPMLDDPLARDVAVPVLARIGAKTLLMGAEQEPGGPEAAAWYGERIPVARVELVPPGAVGDVDGRLCLADVWDRVLAHVAVGTEQSALGAQERPARP